MILGTKAQIAVLEITLLCVISMSDLRPFCIFLLEISAFYEMLRCSDSQILLAICKVLIIPFF